MKKKAKKHGQRDEIAGTVEGETKLVSALEAAVAEKRLVLLGDPGAGKSTFVRRLAAWLAAAEVGKAELPHGFESGLLPIFIVLRDLVPYLTAIVLENLSGEQRRQSFVTAVRQLVQDDLRRWDGEDFSEGILRTLSSGKCLLVLDGLDEVPQDVRYRVRLAVGALIGEYHLQRIIVTCRVRSYSGEAVLQNFKTHRLASFDEKKIDQFAKAWYNAQKDLGRVDADQAKFKADDLSQAARGPDLRELSENPMMLTAMAIIHQKEIGLPRERVRLYQLVVDILLRRWQARKVSERDLAPSPALAELFRDDLQLRKVVERLAYEAHRSLVGKSDLADLPRGEALTLLEGRDYLASPGLASEFLDYVDQRAGLLVGRGGDEEHPAVYSFPHRTFQEYLAGCYMIGQRDLAREFYARAGEGDNGNLAAQLGVEELYYNRRNPNALLDLAYQLFPGTETLTKQSQRATLWAGYIITRLGTRAVEEDCGTPSGGKRYLERLRPALVNLLSSALGAVERADAGRLLAKLGDPRQEVLDVDAMCFCFVPAGSFCMGSERQTDPDAYDDEEPQHSLDLPSFWISQYPVTQAQFAQFVQAGGYGRAEFWEEAAKDQHWEGGGVIRRIFDGSKFINETANQPFDYGEPFGLSNHPVVGVTWYEALAFTRWLEERWQIKRKIPTGWKVCLPSEAEWEKASRGGLHILTQPNLRTMDLSFMQKEGSLQDNPHLARRYPWGDIFDPNNANMADTGIGTTSAVGCFASGASPYGVQDMSGNVWEWTRSLWGKKWEKADYRYPYKSTDGRESLEAPDSSLRVLRGGAFDFYSGGVRCAFRHWGSPYFRINSLGFRVVVSPSAPGL